jgi:quercetin dioxygenase-like cupin family protein
MIAESFFLGVCTPDAGSPEGVALRIFVSAACGATGFSTGTATFEPGAVLPYHLHGCSEAITVLAGEALVVLAGRNYRMNRLDCMHVPAGVPHMIQNARAEQEMIAHWSFASAAPQRMFIDGAVTFEDRDLERPGPGDPEHLRRFADAEGYEPAEGTWFSDLFAKRFGAAGICGGYGRFKRGSSLPCHMHVYDESITILSGNATCMVQGSSYELMGVSTAFVPQGKPHRFLNSGENEMEMLWVYAGDEPDRLLVDSGYCSGLRTWQPGEVKILQDAKDA